MIASLLVLLLAADDSPERVTRAFFEQFAGGNLACAREYVTPASQREIERRYARILEIRCMRIEQMETNESIDGERATVDVALTMTEWKRAAPEHVVSRAWRAELLREEGAWRIDALVEREAELARELTDAPSDAARRELLARNASLVTPALGEALCRRGVTLVNQVRIEEAAAAARLAHAIAEESGDERLLSSALGLDSVLARRVEDREGSLDFGQRAVDAARRTGDPDTILRANLRMIRVRRDRDERLDEQLLQESLRLTDDVEDLASAALVCTQAAWWYEGEQMRREALGYSIRAERLAEQTDDHAARVSALMNVGGAYHNKYDTRLGRVHYLRALDLAKEAGFRETIASLQHYLTVGGTLEENRRRLDDAVASLGTDGERPMRVRTHLARAWLRGHVGDFAGAEEDLAAARALHTTRIWSAALDAAEGSLRAQQRRYADYVRLTEPLARTTPDPFIQHGLASAYRALGRHGDAETTLREAIAIVEQRRPTISADPRQLRAFMQATSNIYVELVDLLAECGRAHEALALHERYKASVLRDVLMTGLLPERAPLEPKERARLELLNERLAELNRGNGGRSMPREAELHAVRLELDEVAARMYVDHPELAWRAIDEGDFEFPAERGVVYVVYVVGIERTTVMTVRRDREGRPVIRAHTIAVTSEKLHARIREYLRRLETRDFSIDDEAMRLYNLLLRPVANEVFRTGQRICIIPDGELWRLPFHALKPSADSYVLDRAVVSYAPSITAALAMQRHPRAEARPRLLAVADATIPEAAGEVSRLRSIYGPERSRVAAATESAVRDADRYDVLHIAAHGVIEKNAPMYSALLLQPGHEAEDGRLEAREIAAMKLDGRLVVLAACETAVGETGAAEGIVGIPWAVIAAGARSAVLAQWPVDSKSAAETMVSFHRGYARGDTAAVALRNAQRLLLRIPQYRHPLYWAPFIAVGAP